MFFIGLFVLSGGSADSDVRANDHRTLTKRLTIAIRATISGAYDQSD